MTSTKPAPTPADLADELRELAQRPGNVDVFELNALRLEALRAQLGTEAAEALWHETCDELARRSRTALERLGHESA